MNDYELRFPIGEFDLTQIPAKDSIPGLIQDIADTPSLLRTSVLGLSQTQLDTRYRPGGWTVRQVVHHLPDSHLNSYVRLKLALTEDTPTIRPYNEAAWAELPDSAGPVELSLALLDHLHERWVFLWRALGDGDWSRVLNHPELGGMRVDQLLAFYAWHGKHHVAHITRLQEREGR